MKKSQATVSVVFVAVCGAFVQYSTLGAATLAIVGLWSIAMAFKVLE